MFPCQRRRYWEYKIAIVFISPNNTPNFPLVFENSIKKASSKSTPTSIEVKEILWAFRRRSLAIAPEVKEQAIVCHFLCVLSNVFLISLYVKPGKASPFWWLEKEDFYHSWRTFCFWSFTVGWKWKQWYFIVLTNTLIITN